MDLLLSQPISSAEGVGPKRIPLFEKAGIHTLEDALFYLPFRYEDRRPLQTLSRVRPREKACFIVEILKVETQFVGKQRRFIAEASDSTGRIQLTWFRGDNFLVHTFRPKQKFWIYGEVEFFRGSLTMAHPEYELYDPQQKTFHFGRVVPIYHETRGLTQKLIRKTIGEVLKTYYQDKNTSLQEELAVPNLKESFLQVHYPRSLNPQDLRPYVARLKFEEYFWFQLLVLWSKNKSHQKKSRKMEDAKNWLPLLEEALPFELTSEQRKVWKEVALSLSSNIPMGRLLQGDVGSGKTIIGLMAALVGASAGFQSVFLVPTEILAEQQFSVAKKLFSNIPVRLGLVTQGSQKKNKKGEYPFDLLIGTHALLEDKVTIPNLAVAVIDEQHRFGVNQRLTLVRKNKAFEPHLLLMTATPIPRTLSFTLYGDLELSTIREKPKGRKDIQTRVLLDRERPELYSKIRGRVSRGEQVYLIYPLIESSEEKEELKSAKEMHELLSKQIFPDMKIGLLHGKMKSEEKEKVLNAFRAREYMVLVSTTVVEVGVDVPNATLMVIEHADRLGLSQLHQLRGRVGRGDLESECLLVTEKPCERLQILAQTNDGFKIAEEDLKIRGPGTWMGVKQHGETQFRVMAVENELEILLRAKEKVMEVLSQDPLLESAAHETLRKSLKQKLNYQLDYLKV